METGPKNRLKEIPVKVLAATLLFLLSVGLFSLVAHEVVLEKEDWFDSRVFHLLKNHSTPGILLFFRTVTFFGSTFFLLPAYFLLVVFLLIKKRRADAIDVTIIALTSNLLMHVLKAYFKRHRPDLPLLESLYTYSFPSGHALSSFIFFSVLTWLTWKSGWTKAAKWLLSFLFILFSLSIGISRIVLRYHYASDVLAGFCLGFAWVMLSLWVQKKLRH